MTLHGKERKEMMTERSRPRGPYEFLPEVPSFAVTSDDIADGKALTDEHLYNGFGVSGGNLSPHLKWEGFPPETQSFAITWFAPDAPTGSGFWHWVLFDIPPDVTELPRGAGNGTNEGLPKEAIHARS